MAYYRTGTNDFSSIQYTNLTAENVKKNVTVTVKDPNDITLKSVTGTYDPMIIHSTALSFINQAHTKDTNEHVWTNTVSLAYGYTYLLTVTADSPSSLGGISITISGCAIETIASSTQYICYKATPRSSGGSAVFYVKYNDDHDDHNRGCVFLAHRLS